MNNKDISALLKKAEELKALFILGQRVIPFLEEIFMFVNEIQPLLDDINKSIEDNLSRMPNASKQLSKVTEATELATTEIMDIVDGIVYKSEVISNNVKDLCELNNNKSEAPLQILELLNKAIKQDSNMKEIQPLLSSAIKNLKEKNKKEQDQLIENTDELLHSISNDSQSIMMSLQVQDITSQQIAAVNNLLETIQNKLKTILSQFRNTEIGDLVSKDKYTERTNVSRLHREIAFDPEAVDSLTSKDIRQDRVDDFMKQHIESENSGSASQDDIDAIFESGDSGEDQPRKDTEEKQNEEISEDDINAMFAGQAGEKEKSSKAENIEDISTETEDLNEEISPDDIDAMFAGGAEEESSEASQDDIDAMFEQMNELDSKDSEENNDK